LLKKIFWVDLIDVKKRLFWDVRGCMKYNRRHSASGLIKVAKAAAGEHKPKGASDSVRFLSLIYGNQRSDGGCAF
jgi:hypothetical protein